MESHYPSIAPHYKRYARTIQQANSLRYALLHHYGGVYLDLDITCLEPLNNLMHLPLLTPGAYPAGVNNAFILARPRHGFLSSLLENLPRHDLRWPMPYVENMLTTGCMYLSNIWMEYVRNLLASDGAEEDRVYILADQHGAPEPHMLRGKVKTPLFEHGGASSWHDWDAAAVVLIGTHY
ncbi:glycosyltransferase family 32 protein, partial [Baudoinia panamericana UAMH 10762]